MNLWRLFIWYPWHYPQPPAGISRINWLELIVCTLIIGVLAAMGTTIFQNYRQMAWVSGSVIGALASTAKTEMAVYYALTGDWPKSIDQTRTQSWSLFLDQPPAKDRFIQNLFITEGTLQLRLAAPFAGRTVSIRPAVPLTEPFGPVVWFAGAPLKGDEWRIEGPDDTDVPEQFICPKLR